MTLTFPDKPWRKDYQAKQLSILFNCSVSEIVPWGIFDESRLNQSDDYHCSEEAAWEAFDQKHEPLEGKNAETLSSFATYCAAHPEERFWQALRNWSKWGFILVSDFPVLDLIPDPEEAEEQSMFDTFNFEGKGPKVA